MAPSFLVFLWYYNYTEKGAIFVYLYIPKTVSKYSIKKPYKNTWDKKIPAYAG